MVIAPFPGAVKHQVGPCAVLEQPHFVILTDGCKVVDGLLQGNYLTHKGDVLSHNRAHFSLNAVKIALAKVLNAAHLAVIPA